MTPSLSCAYFPLQLLIRKVKELVPSPEEMVSFTSLLETRHGRGMI